MGALVYVASSAILNISNFCIYLSGVGYRDYRLTPPYVGQMSVFLQAVQGQDHPGGPRWMHCSVWWYGRGPVSACWCLRFTWEPECTGGTTEGTCHCPRAVQGLQGPICSGQVDQLLPRVEGGQCVCMSASQGLRGQTSENWLFNCFLGLQKDGQSIELLPEPKGR